MSNEMDNIIATIADKVAGVAAECLLDNGVGWDDKAIDSMREWIISCIDLRFRG